MENLRGPFRLTGLYDGSRFTECRTGLAWPVDESRAAGDLKQDYLKSALGRARRPALVVVDARLEQAGGGEEIRIQRSPAAAHRRPPVPVKLAVPMDNLRVLLASRPTGWVSEDNFRVESVPLPQPREGEVLVKNALPLARPLHARPHERGQVLRRQAGDRRGDDRRHRRRGGRVEAPEVREGRQGARHARLAAVRRVRRQGPATRSTPAACRSRPTSACSACPASPRGSACSTSASRRRARRCVVSRRLGRGRQRGRADRQAQGLPRGRHRRRQGEVRLRGAGARLRRLRRLQGRQAQRRPEGGAARTASTATSRTSAARSSTRCCAA